MKKKTLLIAGGTGSIGSAFIYTFKHQYNIICLSRTTNSQHKNIKTITWAWLEKNQSFINQVDYILNLCGKNILTYWSRNNKKKLYESRINPTQTLSTYINKATKKPTCLINASAIGFYAHNPKINTQYSYKESDPVGTGYMSTLCKDWEESALEAKTRVILLRTGIVLDKSTGFLNLICKAYRFFIGGHLGNGNQALPWIHIHDLCSIIHFSLTTKTLSGPINAVAPPKTSLKECCQSIGKTLNKPNWLHVPEKIIRIFLGEMAITLLNTPYIEPHTLINHKFEFKFKSLSQALTHLLKR